METTLGIIGILLAFALLIFLIMKGFNIFNVFDAPVLRAISVRGLYFQENTINKTQAYPPYTWQKSTFLLTGCREVEIRKNSWDTRYTSREIVTERMKTQDLYIDSTEVFVVNPK